MKTTTPSYFPRLFCVLAVLGLVSPVVAQDFRITTLTPNNAVVVEANPIVGDDRGGIAVSSSQVFLTGDVATGRFNRDTLAGGVSVGTVRDGLVANLANDTVYLLGNGSTPLAYGHVQLAAASGRNHGRAQWHHRPPFLPHPAGGHRQHDRHLLGLEPHRGA